LNKYEKNTCFYQGSRDRKDQQLNVHLKSELLQLAFFVFSRAKMVHVNISEKIEDMLRPLVTSLGLELVEIEYKREGRQMILRIFIDKEGGVTLDDCAAVSKEFSALLDVEDIVPGKFTLEVSSPGLDRPLKTLSDYVRYTGKLVKIKTFAAIADDAGNLRKTFLGKLLGMEGDVILLKLQDGQSASIPFSAVAKANLEFEM
jgi:ribosome maturation factor RimP